MIRNRCGGLSLPIDSIVVMTSVPLSDDVMNHVANKKVASADMATDATGVSGAVAWSGMGGGPGAQRATRMGSQPWCSEGAESAWFSTAMDRVR